MPFIVTQALALDHSIIDCIIIYTGVIHFPTAAHFGRSNATILVRNLGCTGVEESLQECRLRNYSTYYYHGSSRYAQIYFMMSVSAKISSEYSLLIPLGGKKPV